MEKRIRLFRQTLDELIKKSFYLLSPYKEPSPVLRALEIVTHLIFIQSP